MRSLNLRQSRFIDEYILDGNATQASIRAGYARAGAGQTGANLLKHPQIAAAIASAKHQRSTATAIDAAWVLREAVSLYRRCMQEVRPVLHPKTRQQMKDDAGNLLFTFNAAAAARALELVGKHTDVGAFEERITLTGELSLIDRLNAGRARSRGANIADTIDGEFHEIHGTKRAPAEAAFVSLPRN